MQKTLLGSKLAEKGNCVVLNISFLVSYVRGLTHHQTRPHIREVVSLFKQLAVLVELTIEEYSCVGHICVFK